LRFNLTVLIDGSGMRYKVLPELAAGSNIYEEVS
jgi:hypothetical protein